VTKACTIGTFDGLHLGHQALLERCRDLGDPVVVTFDPHPRKVLQSESPPLIQSLSERIDFLERYGVSTVEVLTFSLELAQRSHEDFLAELHARNPFDYLVLGRGSALGKGRRGTADALRTTGRRLGFELHEVDPVAIEGRTVSSSAIRHALHAGDLELVRAFLGRPFSISGQVIAGAGRGARIGFPTANLIVHGRAMPPKGVYAGWARKEGSWQRAVLNYGAAPTFGRDEEILEVHLLEGTHHLVGHQLHVIPCRFLRPQVRFESVEELQKQLLLDCQPAYYAAPLSQTDFPV
jgi:riboflavin kinase/FMN adenylyltransferase